MGKISINDKIVIENFQNEMSIKRWFRRTTPRKESKSFNLFGAYCSL